MAPLTWRNIDAPDFSGVSEALARSQMSFRDAFSGLSDMAKARYEQQRDTTSAQARLAAAGYTDANAYQRDLAAGRIAGTSDPSMLNSDALSSLEGRGSAILGDQNTRLGMDQTRQNMSLALSREGREASDHARTDEMRTIGAQVESFRGQAAELRSRGMFAEADAMDQKAIDLSLQHNFSDGVSGGYGAITSGNASELNAQAAGEANKILGINPNQREAYIRNLPLTLQGPVRAALGSMSGGSTNGAGGAGGGDAAASGGAPSGGGSATVPNAGVLGNAGDSRAGTGVIQGNGFVDLIDATEGGGDYNTLYSHAQRDGGRFAGVNVTGMTIGELLNFQRGEYGQWVQGENNGTFASPVGRFQIVGRTLENAAREMGLDLNTTRFTPEVQNAIAMHLARGRISRGSTMAEKRTQLRQEWVGLRNVGDDQLDAAIRQIQGTPEGPVLDFGDAVTPEQQANFDSQYGNMGNMDAGGLNFGGNPFLNMLGNVGNSEGFTPMDVPDVTPLQPGQGPTAEQLDAINARTSVDPETTDRLLSYGDTHVAALNSSRGDEVFLDNRTRMRDVYDNGNMEALQDELYNAMGGEEGSTSKVQVRSAINQLVEEYQISPADAASAIYASIGNASFWGDKGVYGTYDYSWTQAQELAERIGQRGGIESMGEANMAYRQMGEEWSQVKDELDAAKSDYVWYQTQQANNLPVDTDAMQDAADRYLEADKAVQAFDWSQYETLDTREKTPEQIAAEQAAAQAQTQAAFDAPGAALSAQAAQANSTSEAAPTSDEPVDYGYRGASFGLGRPNAETQAQEETLRARAAAAAASEATSPRDQVEDVPPFMEIMKGFEPSGNRMPLGMRTETGYAPSLVNAQLRAAVQQPDAAPLAQRPSAPSLASTLDAAVSVFGERSNEARLIQRIMLQPMSSEQRRENLTRLYQRMSDLPPSETRDQLLGSLGQAIMNR